MTDSASDSRSLARGFATNAIGILLRTSRIGFLWVVASMYGTTEYAVYTLSFAVFDVLLFVALAGFDNALWNFIPRFHDSKPALERACLRTAIVLTTGVAVVLGGGLWVSADWVAAEFFQKPAVAYGLRWMAAILPLAALARVLFAATRGLGIMKYYVIGIEFTEPMAMLLLGLLALPFHHAFPSRSTGVFAAHLISELTVVLIAIRLFGRHFSWGDWLRGESSWFHRPTLQYALALGSVNISALLARRVDILMVGRYLPVAQVAVYNLSSDLAYALLKLRSAFTPVVVPLLAEASERNEMGRVRHSTKLSALWSTAGAFPPLFVYLLFGGWLIGLFNLDSGIGHPVLCMLAVSHFISTGLGPVGEVISSQGKPHVYTIFSSLPLLLLFFLGPVAIPSHGPIAAASLAGGGAMLAKLPQVLFAWIKFGVHPFSPALGSLVCVGIGLAAAMAVGKLILPDYENLTAPLFAAAFTTLFGAWVWKRRILHA